MIEVEQAQKKYAAKEVLKAITFKLEQGEACGLLGGNGAGKSTLIKSIMGLTHLDSGSIQTQGFISFLPEQAYLPENMTAWQLVSLACAMQNETKSAVNTLLEEVSLAKSAWHKKIAQYSKGMKQRTAIAYALAGKPDWLILDEPMSGLDAMGRIHILDLLRKRHQEGVGILMCSHIVTDMVRVCDAVLIVADGEIKDKVVIQNQSIEQANILEQMLKKWGSYEAVV